MLAFQTPSVGCVNKTRLMLEMRSHDQLVRGHPDPIEPPEKCETPGSTRDPVVSASDVDQTS
jgi:hypothetical protein